jgi:hypothetical protein
MKMVERNTFVTQTHENVVYRIILIGQMGARVISAARFYANVFVLSLPTVS